MFRRSGVSAMVFEGVLCAIQRETEYLEPGRLSTYNTASSGFLCPVCSAEKCVKTVNYDEKRLT